MRLKLKTAILVSMLLLELFGNKILFAQLGELRWMRVGTLRSFFSEQGAEVEGGRGTPTLCDGLAWPAEYGMIQSSINSRAIWIGAKNVYAPGELKTYPVRVVGRGTRDVPNWDFEIFPIEHKMIGKFESPQVLVNSALATEMDYYDEVDEIDENLICDRMIVTRFNTIVGVSVTRKIMAFSQQNHDDYFIYDYVFKNTGIFDKNGTVHEQTLEDCYFLFRYRYALSGESVTGYEQGWGVWNTTWGRNFVNHVVGRDPTDPNFEFRAIYGWYGPHSERSNTNDWDWGCPNDLADPLDNRTDESMAAARYIGVVVLHADTDVNDKNDDPTQPRTTMFTGSDISIFQGHNAFNEVIMQQRYDHMKSGHAVRTHYEEILDQGIIFPDTYGNDGGGYGQSQGFGHYTLEPGDSIHIVFAEAVGGLSREKNREVTKNWLLHVNGLDQPTLKLPDGSTTDNADQYKKEWVQSCKDSLFQLFRRIVDAYQNGLNIPQPSPPPEFVEVAGGGDRIRVTWANNAQSHPNFDGYEVWRAKGSVDDPLSVYDKIFACNAANVVHQYDDTTAIRGFDHYYYVVSKDDGSTNDANPGQPLVSSKFYTMTNQPAQLLRKAGKTLEEIRVVPNPYVISKRDLQFYTGSGVGYDRISFYNIPAFCKIRIYTERGDLVWEKDHDDSSGDEYWESVTSSGQIVVSGIYIAYIEVTEDYVHPDTGEIVYRKGDHTYRKIMIIR